MKEKRFELKEIVKYISNYPLDDNFSVYIKRQPGKENPDCLL